MSAIETTQLRCTMSSNVDVNFAWRSIVRPPKLPCRQASVTDDTAESDHSSPSIRPNASENNSSPKLPRRRGSAVTGATPSRPMIARDSSPPMRPNDSENNASPKLPRRRGSVEKGATPSRPMIARLYREIHSERYGQDESNDSSFPPRVIFVPSREALGPPSQGYINVMSRFEPPPKSLSCVEFNKLRSIIRPPRLPSRQLSIDSPLGGGEAAPVTPITLTRAVTVATL
jgi:hypothetical protein